MFEQKKVLKLNLFSLIYNLLTIECPKVLSKLFIPIALEQSLLSLLSFSFFLTTFVLFINVLKIKL